MSSKLFTMLLLTTLSTSLHSTKSKGFTQAKGDKVYRTVTDLMRLPFEEFDERVAKLQDRVDNDHRNNQKAQQAQIILTMLKQRGRF